MIETVHQFSSVTNIADDIMLIVVKKDYSQFTIANRVTHMIITMLYCGFLSVQILFNTNIVNNSYRYVYDMTHVVLTCIANMLSMKQKTIKDTMHNETLKKLDDLTKKNEQLETEQQQFRQMFEDKMRIFDSKFETHDNQFNEQKKMNETFAYGFHKYEDKFVEQNKTNDSFAIDIEYLKKINEGKNGYIGF